MTLAFGDLEQTKIKEAILKLTPGPILIFPYGSIYPDSPLNCFFSVSLKHPLVNDCALLYPPRQNQLMKKIKTTSEVCDQIAIARNEDVKNFIFLDYDSTSSSKECVEKLAGEALIAPEIKTIRLSKGILVLGFL